MTVMLARFRKGLTHVVAWFLATTAAVTLSWLGVHSVLADTAYDPPRAVPIAGDGATSGDTTPLASSTHRPMPSAVAGRPTAWPVPSASVPSRARPAGSPAPSASVRDGAVRGYDTRGGRVVLDVGENAASLVSATPSRGWSMRVWKAATRIRVEFRAGAREVSLVCDWHGHRPQVRIAQG
jgi:hypothetical protein